MIKQSQITEIIECSFTGYYTDAETNRVSKAVAKFLNKYNDYYISTLNVIDACLQMRKIEKDLFAFLEREKLNYIVKK